MYKILWRNIMSDFTYKKLLSENDTDIDKLLQIYGLPDVSRFINISDNYFHYVTNTENVYFYKIYIKDKLFGTIHLEKHKTLLYMDILIFPEFQRMGLATKVIKDIQQDIFKINYDKIVISIDEINVASIRLFEKCGFLMESQEDELLNYVYKNE